MKKLFILLTFLFLIIPVFGEKIAEFPEINNPNPAFNPLILDTDGLIITDGIKIYIYSPWDYSLKATFGKAGEGPREFVGYDRGTAVITEVDGKQILVNSLKKLTFFSKEGNYIKEIKTNSGWWFKPMGEGFLGYAGKVEGTTQYDTINLYNADLTPYKQVFKSKQFIQKGAKINLFEYRRPLPLVIGDLIVINSKKGEINIFDKEGKIKKTFLPPYQKIKFEKQHKDEMIASLKLDPRLKVYYELFKGRIEFPEYFPPLRNMKIADGKIYLLTYLKKDKKPELLTYDLEAKALGRDFVPLVEKNTIEVFPFTIHKGSIFQLIENDETGNMELHRFKLQTSPGAGKGPGPI